MRAPLVGFVLVSLFLGSESGCLHPDCSKNAAARHRKQAERQQEFATYAQNFPVNAEMDVITGWSFPELMDNLLTRRISAVQVLRAHIAKSVNVTREFNCVTNFVPEAMAIAVQLDASPVAKGPLHGLPVCVKEDTDIYGMDTTVGLSRFLYKPASENAVLVQRLLNLGAVPFCKTNLPQGHLGAPGSHNPIFGNTLNSLNKRMSPGGSSSGSACLVAAGAVKVATATDVAGSARIPAHFHGIAGMTTTPNRISAKGIRVAVDIPYLQTAPGFITDRADTMAFVYGAIAQDQLYRAYDSQVQPSPWRPELLAPTRPLKIAVLSNNYAFPPIGDTLEVLEKAAQALRQKGHAVEQMEDLVDLNALYLDSLGIVGIHNGEQLVSYLRSDRTSPTLYVFRTINVLPQGILKLLANLPFTPRRSRVLIKSQLDYRNPTVREGNIDRLNQTKARLLAEMDRRGVDLIMTPVFPSTAPLNQFASLMFGGISYTIPWNTLHFPAGTVNFGHESGKNIPSYNADKDPLLWLTKQLIPSSVGMPIGVQFIGRPFEDELVLRGMIELESLIKAARSM